MTRHKGKVDIQISQLREFAEQLRNVATLCDDNCDLAVKRERDVLSVTHYKTALDGIESISKFIGAVYCAATESNLKSPILVPVGKDASKQLAQNVKKIARKAGSKGASTDEVSQ